MQVTVRKEPRENPSRLSLCAAKYAPSLSLSLVVEERVADAESAKLMNFASAQRSFWRRYSRAFAARLLVRDPDAY